MRPYINEKEAALIRELISYALANNMLGIRQQMIASGIIDKLSGSAESNRSLVGMARLSTTPASKLEASNWDKIDTLLGIPPNNDLDSI
jgi:hypothetical protein